MAVAPNPRLISPDEYLHTSYRPDLEFVDGFLVERGKPTIAHALLQAILTAYFRQFRSELRYTVLTEGRTQIVERSRYRIPDVMLCQLPLPRGPIMTAVPWAVIEILSPDDRLPEQLQRFRDYESVGVSNLVLMDPEQRIAFKFERGSLIQTQFESLELPTGNVPFNSDSLFLQLSEELNQE